MLEEVNLEDLGIDLDILGDLEPIPSSTAASAAPPSSRRRRGRGRRRRRQRAASAVEDGTDSLPSHSSTSRISVRRTPRVVVTRPMYVEKSTISPRELRRAKEVTIVVLGEKKAVNSLCLSYGCLRHEFAGDTTTGTPHLYEPKSRHFHRIPLPGRRSNHHVILSVKVLPIFEELDAIRKAVLMTSKATLFVLAFFCQKKKIKRFEEIERRFIPEIRAYERRVYLLDMEDQAKGTMSVKTPRIPLVLCGLLRGDAVDVPERRIGDDVIEGVCERSWVDCFFECDVRNEESLGQVFADAANVIVQFDPVRKFYLSETKKRARARQGVGVMDDSTATRPKGADAAADSTDSIEVPGSSEEDGERSWGGTIEEEEKRAELAVANRRKVLLSRKYANRSSVPNPVRRIAIPAPKLKQGGSLRGSTLFPFTRKRSIRKPGFISISESEPETDDSHGSPEAGSRRSKLIPLTEADLPPRAPRIPAAESSNSGPDPHLIHLNFRNDIRVQVRDFLVVAFRRIKKNYVYDGKVATFGSQPQAGEKDDPLAAKLDRVVGRLNRGRRVSVMELPLPILLALIKKVLSSMDEPVSKCKNHRSFIDAAGLPDRMARIRVTQQIMLDELQNDERELMCLVLLFFKQLEKSADKTAYDVSVIHDITKFLTPLMIASSPPSIQSYQDEVACTMFLVKEAELIVLTLNQLEDQSGGESTHRISTDILGDVGFRFQRNSSNAGFFRTGSTDRLKRESTGDPGQRRRSFFWEELDELEQEWQEGEDQPTTTSTGEANGGGLFEKLQWMFEGDEELQERQKMRARRHEMGDVRDSLSQPTITVETEDGHGAWDPVRASQRYFASQAEEDLEERQKRLRERQLQEYWRRKDSIDPEEEGEVEFEVDGEVDGSSKVSKTSTPPLLVLDIDGVLARLKHFWSRGKSIVETFADVDVDELDDLIVAELQSQSQASLKTLGEADDTQTEDDVRTDTSDVVSDDSMQPASLSPAPKRTRQLEDADEGTDVDEDSASDSDDGDGEEKELRLPSNHILRSSYAELKQLTQILESPGLSDLNELLLHMDVEKIDLVGQIQRTSKVLSKIFSKRQRASRIRRNMTGVAASDEDDSTLPDELSQHYAKYSEVHARLMLVRHQLHTTLVEAEDGLAEEEALEAAKQKQGSLIDALKFQLAQLEEGIKQRLDESKYEEVRLELLDLKRKNLLRQKEEFEQWRARAQQDGEDEAEADAEENAE